jgi:hypothetical protein
MNSRSRGKPIDRPPIGFDASNARERARKWYAENKEKLLSRSELERLSSSSGSTRSSTISSRPLSRQSNTTNTDVGFLFDSLEDQLKVLVELVDVHANQFFSRQQPGTDMKDLSASLSVAIEGNLRALSVALKHARAKLLEYSVKKAQVLGSLASTEKTLKDQLGPDEDVDDSHAIIRLPTPCLDVSCDADAQEPSSLATWMSSIKDDLSVLKQSIKKDYAPSRSAHEDDLKGLMEARARLQQQLETFSSPVKRPFSN